MNEEKTSKGEAKIIQKTIPVEVLVRALTDAFTHLDCEGVGVCGIIGAVGRRAPKTTITTLAQIVQEHINQFQSEVSNPTPRSEARFRRAVEAALTL